MSRMRIKVVDVLAGLTLVALVAAPLPRQSDSAGAAQPPSTPSAATPEPGRFEVVRIVGRDYEPGALVVPAGTTIYWVNDDGNAHTASAFDGAFDSGNLSAGEVYTFTPDTPGRHEYGCDYHLDMGGHLTVTG